MVGSLPENYQGFLTSIFKADEIEQVSHNEQKLWIGILNRSSEEDIEIKKKLFALIFCPKNKG